MKQTRLWIDRIKNMIYERGWSNFMLKQFTVYRAFALDLKNKNISAFAAGTAFFIFLSLIPLTMLMLSILPYTPISQADMVNILYDVFPSSFKPLIDSILAECYEKSVALISVSAVIIIWAAAKGTLGMTYGLNALNDVVETRNYVLMRVYACIETLIMIAIILASLVLMVFGNVLVKLILRDFPQTMYIYEFCLKFRFLVSWGVLTLAFTTLYTFFPNKKLKWKKQVPGAVFAAVIWNIFSWAFSIYAEYGNGFTMYGSFATIIIVLIWLYSCIYIFLLGAYLNKTARSTVLEFIAASQDNSEEDKELLKEIIKKRDIRKGKQIIKDIDRSVSENLTDTNSLLHMSEEEQKAVIEQLKNMRKKKKDLEDS